MGSRDFTSYCSFTKAIEHLGDRWSLFILRELGVFGPQGFNDLAGGLPGRISRSILAQRLRRLEDLGLVSHAVLGTRQAPYRLTGAGMDLMATFESLRDWSATWMPDDPAMIDRDPDVVLNWLARRLDLARLPDRTVVVEIRVRHEKERRYWLVLERGIEPYGCLEDPLLEETRYVYVHIGVTSLLALARGSRDWETALADGSVTAYGDPRLTGHLATWFQPAARESEPEATTVSLPARP